MVSLTSSVAALLLLLLRFLLLLLYCGLCLINFPVVFQALLTVRALLDQLRCGVARLRDGLSRVLDLSGVQQGRNLAKFDHVKNERQVVSSEEVAAKQADPAYSLNHMSEDTKRVMAKLNSADSAVVGGSCCMQPHDCLSKPSYRKKCSRSSSVCCISTAFVV